MSSYNSCGYSVFVHNGGGHWERLNGHDICSESGAKVQLVKVQLAVGSDKRVVVARIRGNGKYDPPEKIRSGFFKKREVTIIVDSANLD